MLNYFVSIKVFTYVFVGSLEIKISKNLKWCSDFFLAMILGTKRKFTVLLNNNLIKSVKHSDSFLYQIEDGLNCCHIHQDLFQVVTLWLFVFNIIQIIRIDTTWSAFSNESVGPHQQRKFQDHVMSCSGQFGIVYYFIDI